jgi:replicative DNA helicase
MNAHVPPAPVRDLPKNIEIEQNVLGALFENNAVFARVGGFLEARHFSEELHQRIYEVASSLIKDGKTVTVASVKTFLPDIDLGGVSVWKYLVHLYTNAPGVLIAEDYARMIVDLHCRRSLIEAGTAMVDRAYDLPVGTRPGEIAIGAIGAIQAITEGAQEKNSRRDAGASALGLMDHVKRARAGEIARSGVTTGIPEIDRDTGGFMPGTLWVVGARPGMGKTVLSCSGALTAAKSGAGAILFSLEVPEDQVNARVLSALAYSGRQPIQFGRILRADIDDQEEWRLDEAQQRLAALPLVFDVAPRLSITEIALRVKSEKERMAKKGVGLGVVFLDYLKFIKASDRYRGQRVYEVGEISAGLKELAKSEGVCVVLLAQLNRALENRDDKRPMLSDLRESGDLEADADVVAFIHREAYYLQASPEFKAGQGDVLSRFAELENVAEIAIAKNRAGAVRSHEIWCDVSCSKLAPKVVRYAP